jgi:ABC-type enterochelin transport system permease subunit
MLANAVFVATFIFLTLAFWLMHELHFLVPWRSLILHHYLQSIALYCALLFANILGLTIWIERKFFLRDTGRKLKHRNHGESGCVCLDRRGRADSIAASHPL